MNEFFRKLLDATGGSDGIYAAIDTYDMAKIVQAATIALQKSHSIPMNLRVLKSKAESSAARNKGNEHYKAGRNRLAIQFYNKALLFAPFLSEEMVLAYGNRSAVFYSIRYFSACMEDVSFCLSMKCPPDLLRKLTKRRDDAFLFLHEEQALNIITSTDFVNSFLLFNCKKNADVSCASNNVAFVNRDGAKLVTAANDIKPGTLVALERAFATCTVENQYLCCYYCYKVDLRLYPCRNCCQALFCGRECQELCFKEYHKIECPIVDFLGTTYDKPENMLMTRSAIKLSLELGWDDLIKASRDIGASRMRTATVKQMYNPKEPLSILCYDDNEHLMEGRMFNGSVISAAVLHLLGRIPDYFPKKTKKRDAAVDAMARIMLHLYVTFNNKIRITCSAYDFHRRYYSGDVQTNYGWFSMSSKLKHSCEPNLLVLGLNDTIGLVTLRSIKKGEELTISYIGHLYDNEIPVYDNNSKFKRQIHVLLHSLQTCDCKACVNNWDAKSPVKVKMTKSQEALFKKLFQQKSMDYDCYYSICAVLDAFPINSVQHKCAYETVKGMLKPIQSKHFQNKTTRA